MSPEEIEAIRAAVLEAYERNAEELSRMALALTRNKALAQDVLQETFLRYFLTRMHGESIAKERDWLSAVMRDLLADWRKSAKVQESVALEEVEDIPEQTSGDTSSEPNWAGRAAWILAPREQECIDLRSQGLAYSEIAKAMQISVGTVGALLNRAICKLRQTLPVNTGAT